MAIRNSSREIMSNVIGNDEDYTVDSKSRNNFQQRSFRSRTPIKPPLSRLAPTTTRFDLLTLQEYLRAELRACRIRKAQLNADPALAAVEAEEYYLRRRVYANEPVSADLTNGRLLIDPVRRRSNSVPPGECDTESSHVLKSKTKDLKNAHQTLLQTTPFLKVMTERAPTTSLSQARWFLASSAAASSSGTRSGSVVDPDESAENDRITPITDNDDLYQRFSDTIEADLLLSFDMEDHDKGNDDDYVSTTTNRLPRTLSFQAHTDEVRNSSRRENPISKSDRDPDEKRQSSADSDDRRPRKVAKHTASHSNVVGTFMSSQETWLDEVEAASSNTASLNQMQEQSSIGVVSKFSIDGKGKGRAIDLTEKALAARHNTADCEFDLRLYQFMPDICQPEQQEALTSKKAVKMPLTGRDTFYSESSDTTESEIEKENKMSNDRNIDEAEQPSTRGSHKGCHAKCCGPSVFKYEDVVPEVLPEMIDQAGDNCQEIWHLAGLDRMRKKKTKWVPFVDFVDEGDSVPTQYSVEDLDPDRGNILGAANQFGDYPREWKAREPPRGPYDPPFCHSKSAKDGFPAEVLQLSACYLSKHELRNLRLVNRATAAVLLPLMIRSTVIEFGRALFAAPNRQEWDLKSNYPAQKSLLRVSGRDINKFGISFNFDPHGLANAKTKVIEKKVHAWFGSYIWPIETYPRYAPLKELEDLVEAGRPLLRNTMQSLSEVHELALSVDSGHGWLNGPDISDLALLKMRQTGAPTIFGENFNAKDKWSEFALREYFEWSQRNTINAYAKRLAMSRPGHNLTYTDQKFLARLQVRPYDDYLIQNEQPDFNRMAHTGAGLPSTEESEESDDITANDQQTTGRVVRQSAPVSTVAARNSNVNRIGPSAPPAAAQTSLGRVPSRQIAWISTNPNSGTLFGNTATFQANTVAAGATIGTVPSNTANAAIAHPTIPSGRLPRRANRGSQQASMTNDLAVGTARYILPPATTLVPPSQTQLLQGRPEGPASGKAKPDINPQWPLIFNCHNLAAEMGGSHDSVQSRVAKPCEFPYWPGELTEPQVQWLMETLWAQRAFLSAYTNSIITNHMVFKKVHTVHIATLSSGLIPALAQDEFWASLPALKKLILKINPDWRQEHIPGDKMYQRNMSISPVQASIKLAELLRNNISGLEKLSTLTVGFIGGGEHQTGIFARNCHVLPAPITSDPEAWLSDHSEKPGPESMFVFNHIRDLTFENCWFSPCMLEAFMSNSRDTSLHNLTLNSVSLTGVHDTREIPLTTLCGSLKCNFSPSEWLQEEVPKNACWVNVLENITPGKTILERKYDAEMMDEVAEPRPTPTFRGNIQKIVLQSCGYVKVSGVPVTRLGQNGVVMQPEGYNAMDGGLETRKCLFDVGDTSSRTSSFPAFRSPRRPDRQGIMMSMLNPENNREWFGLGQLTQCIHPIEKRVLERAWNMRFGWGDTMDRWAAVEDGCFEGGTGRFSGIIVREDDE